ncbi:MAG: methyltransferase domain-containing protein [Rhizobiales bacterium]|nr:methyltransferase domain-containing protein [Hyphomicrobiales bacterium]
MDISDLFRGVDEVRLYEGHHGLLFFDPLIPGDAAFYQVLYKSLRLQSALARLRYEFSDASLHVAPGSRVLDVGCGFGQFGRTLTNASYVGIDLSFDQSHSDPMRPDFSIRRQSLEDHIAEGPVPYDVVSAFQVLEHVADPLRFIGNMLSLLRPGGLLIVAVPKTPSAVTEIPAFPINMPPHHLTFWSVEALRRLASGFDLTVEHLDDVRPSPAEDIVHWAHRLSWVRTGLDFARLDRYAILSMLSAALGAKVLSRIIPFRFARATPVNLLLVARKADAV